MWTRGRQGDTGGRRWTGLPAECQVCGAWPAAPLCADCLNHFAAPRLRCTGCALPLPEPLPGGRCNACRSQPPIPDTCLAAVDYGHPWNGLIARLKFRQEPGWAAPLAQLWRRDPPIMAALMQVEALIPIPLTPDALARRGHNQCWELIKALRADTPSCPPGWPQVLGRWRDTQAQHDLNRAARQHNLHGAFWVPPEAVSQVNGRHLMLVDDVRTTGATLDEAARTLRQAGARRVSALVLARTPEGGC